MAESRNRRAFDAKPIIQISGDVRLVAVIIKGLAQDVEMQVLKPHAELPWLAIRRNQRCRSGGLTRLDCWHRTPLWNPVLTL